MQYNLVPPHLTQHEMKESLKTWLIFNNNLGQKVLQKRTQRANFGGLAEVMTKGVAS